jgi:hypothetical protein
MPGVSLGEGGLTLGAPPTSLGELLGTRTLKGATGVVEGDATGLVLSVRGVGVRVTGTRVRATGFLVGYTIGELDVVSGA